MSLAEIKNALMGTGKIVFATGTAFTDGPFNTEATTEPVNESANQVATSEPAIEAEVIPNQQKSTAYPFCKAQTQWIKVGTEQHPGMLQLSRNEPLFSQAKDPLFAHYINASFNIEDIITREEIINIEGNNGHDTFFVLLEGKNFHQIKEGFKSYGFSITSKTVLFLRQYPNGSVSISMVEERHYYRGSILVPYHYRVFKEIFIFRRKGDLMQGPNKWVHLSITASEFFKLGGKKTCKQDQEKEWRINSQFAMPVRPSYEEPSYSADVRSIRMPFKLVTLNKKPVMVLYTTIKQAYPWMVYMNRGYWKYHWKYDQETFQCETRDTSNQIIEKCKAASNFQCVVNCAGINDPVVEGSETIVKPEPVEEVEPVFVVEPAIEAEPKPEPKLLEEPEPVIEPEPEPMEEVELDEDPLDTIGDGEVFVEPDEEIKDLIRHANGWIEAAWRFRNKGARSEGTVKILISNARASVNEILETCPLVGAVLFQDKTPDEALQLLDEIEAGREQKLVEYVMDKQNTPKEKKERAKLPEEEAKQISTFASWLAETRGKSESTTKLYVSQAKSCVRITGGFNWDSYIDSLENKHTINAAKSASKEWECFLFEESQGKTAQQAN